MSVIWTIRLILVLIVQILDWAIFIRCILSFFPDFNNRFTYLVYVVTEPILTPCRKLLERLEFTRTLPFDFAPLLAFLILGFLLRIFA